MTKIKPKDQVSITLSEEQKQALINAKDYADSMMRVGQEFLLATEQILQEDFNFSESDIKQLETRLKDMLQTLAQLERKGLSILSPHDMEQVSDIAKSALLNIKRENAGIASGAGFDPKKLK